MVTQEFCDPPIFHGFYNIWKQIEPLYFGSDGAKLSLSKWSQPYKIGVLSWKATGAWSNTWRELYSTVVFYQQRNISKIRSVLFFSSTEKTFVPLRPLAPITVCFVHLPKQTNRQARKLFKILQLDQWPKQSNSHTSHRFFGFTLLDSIFWKTF